ncbi:MAG: DUF4366 domain-containing protein [Roseburia sp.]|nr:DUF4366 domain-containing protein [Roseburia sp.]
MRKIRKALVSGLTAAALLSVPVTAVHASGEDEKEYITISVEASDDNEGITYAIDSPDNFSTQNTFTIPAGTSHTIYVKDAAGNVTSQTYEPPGEVSAAESSPEKDDAPDYGGGYDPYDGSRGEADDGGRTINIDLELGKTQDNAEAYEKNPDTPAEPGGGTVYSKTFPDGTDGSRQVFYSVTTTDGDVFYLLIDQGAGADNVYLLSQVSTGDLNALAADEGGASGKSSGKEEGDSLLKALSGDQGDDGAGAAASSASKSSGGGVNRNAVIVCIVIAAGGGVYYYQTIYRKKKEQEMDAMDAADIGQFEAETDTDADDEFDFAYGEKEEFLRNLMNSDEAEFEAAAAKEAAAGGWGPETDTERDAAYEEHATSHIPEEDGSAGTGDETAETAEDDIFGAEPDDGEYDPELDGEEE